MCSGFNLVDEVQTGLDSLKKQAKSLSSASARAAAENTILGMTQFLEDLAKDFDTGPGPGEDFADQEAAAA